MNYFLFLIIKTSQGKERTVLKSFSNAFRRGVYYNEVKRIIHRKGGTIDSAIAFDSPYTQEVLFGVPAKFDGEWSLNCTFESNGVIELRTKGTEICKSFAQACMRLYAKEKKQALKKFKLKYASLTNTVHGTLVFAKGFL